MNLKKLTEHKSKAVRIALSCAVCAVFLGAATGFNFLFAHLKFPEANIVLVYMLCVILVTSFTEGFLYGMATGVLSIVLFNIFFAEPYYSFSVYDSGYIVTFSVMTIAAIFTSTLTSKIKSTAREVNQKEKLAIEERYRANLLRAISHDIRTPLSSIIGNTEILLDGNQESNTREKLEEIHEDASWLHSLVENILNLTRLRDGKLAIKKVPEALEEVVEVAVRRANKAYPNTKISVKMPSEFLSVPMDGKLIAQVLANLLENAVKHSGANGEITVEFYREGQSAVVKVLDNGSGIDEDDLSRIFEMFYTKGGKERKGKGLGLAICDAIIRAHEGEIFAKNRTDVLGAEFTFKLPIEVQE